MQSAINFLLPGGYLEYQDGILPVKYKEPPPPESAFVKWTGLTMEASIKIGRPLTNGQLYSQWMREAGLVDIEERKFSLAIGTWPENARDKKLGDWNRQNWIEAMEGPTMKLFAVIGWEMEECKVLVAQARQDLMNDVVKPYVDVIVCWGRKPIDEHL
jgi:hypothetical protein